MIPQLTHPSSVTLLGELASLFKSRRIFTTRDRLLVFLCGGPTDAKATSLRRFLLDYGRRQLKEFRFFLAEDAARDLFQHGHTEFVNFAEFETLISKLADCVLVIPESAGSIAELGFFAAHRDIRKKMLVVNNLAHQASESFLNLGPIDIVNKKSRFHPAIHVPFRGAKTDYQPIAKRLKRSLPEIRGHFEFRLYDKLPLPHRLFVIFEMIFLFGKATPDAVEVAVQFVFNRNKPLTPRRHREFHQLLSILCAGKYLKRIETPEELIEVEPGTRPFLEIPETDRNSIRIKVADFSTRIGAATPEPRSRRRR